MADSVKPSLTVNSITFPLSRLSPSHLFDIHQTAPTDQVLKVNFPETVNDTPTNLSRIPLPPYPCLKYIHIECPSDDPLYPLLDFRLALQAADVPLLTHLTLSNVCLDSILALRWGSFTSFGESDWHGANVWRNLKHLDLRLEPPRFNSSPRIDGTHAEAVERRKQEQQQWRTGIKILHDWLNSFAYTGTSTSSGLESLRFEWLEYEGPNPLLLDLEVDETTGSACTTAPAINWNKLQKIWLRGIRVGEQDVRDIKQRATQLQFLLVDKELLKDNTTIGWDKQEADCRWWEVSLGKRRSAIRMLSSVDEGAEDVPENSRGRHEAGTIGKPLSKATSASSMNVTLMMKVPSRRTR